MALIVAARFYHTLRARLAREPEIIVTTGGVKGRRMHPKNKTADWAIARSPRPTGCGPIQVRAVDQMCSSG